MTLDMAWIRTIAPDSPDAARGRLARLYRQHSENGRVDNILKISSLNPKALFHHLGLYGHLMRGEAGSGLGLAERELAAVAVSSVNDCHY